MPMMKHFLIRLFSISYVLVVVPFIFFYYLSVFLKNSLDLRYNLVQASLKRNMMKKNAYSLNETAKTNSNSFQEYSIAATLIITPFDLFVYSGLLICGFAFFLLLLSFIIEKTSYKKLTSYKTAEHSSMYECGFEPFIEPMSSFYINFYIIAILFLLFDLELLMLIPFYICLFKKVESLVVLFAFFFAIVFGYLIEWKAKSFNWTQSIISTNNFKPLKNSPHTFNNVLESSTTLKNKKKCQT